jgi:PPIC-type PPIASE domain
MSILKSVFFLAFTMLALAAPGGAQSPGMNMPKEPSAEAVALTEPVLTVHHDCPSAAKPEDSETCDTVLTRQEFDELMEIAAPGAKTNAGARRNVARMYSELLAFEAAAHKAGISDSHEFQEILQLLRLRALADLYRRNLEKQYETLPQEEIAGYYHREIRRFEEVKLRRIVLPKNNFAAANKEQFEKQALQVANELRERAAKGEDFDQLQKEAFSKLAFTGQPPVTDGGSRRRAGLLPEVADEIFTLNPGQVSRVETEPYSFVIYKVEARRTLPLEMVRDEISRELAKQKLEDALKTVTGSIHADLNQKYFGAAEGQPGSAGSAADSRAR